MRHKPLLLFFASPRCGRSRRADGFLAQVLQHRGNHGTFSIRCIDPAERPDLVERLGVRVIPTVLVVDDERIRARVEQPRGVVPLERALAPWLRGPAQGRHALSNDAISDSNARATSRR